MPTKVLVPRLGEGVEEITLTKWLKHEGEAVNELEPLLEVNTDKVDTEIPSPAAGTVLKLVLSEGITAKVGEVLAWIGQPGEAIPGESGERVQAPREAVTPAVTVGEAGNAAGLGFLSPVVAKLAAEHSVDLRRVKGTGLGGRITKNDVLAFLESPKAGTAAPASPPAPAAGDSLVPLSAIRRQIAEHMLQSKRTSPHVLTVMEADLHKIVADREANKQVFAAEGLKLTFTAYFVAAIAAGLQAHPGVNASWSEAGVVLHKAINIGMAVSLGDDGLIVPVIKNAGNLSLQETVRIVNDLAERARTRKLQPDEVHGGTFTLTNHGISGSLLAMPIINQPQSGILGVGAIQRRVVAIEDAIAIRPMVYLSFVFDHRILDGVGADRFLMKVKQTLEDWA